MKNEVTLPLLSLFTFLSCASHNARNRDLSQQLPREPTPPTRFEVLPANEQKNIDEITAIIERYIAKKYEEPKSRPALRDAHAKAHGCVKATFSVNDIQDEKLKKGLFAKPGKYRAYVRFSNGGDSKMGDHIPDGRGMAIKVMGVDMGQNGERRLSLDVDAEINELHTQDFLLINYPQFFMDDLDMYVRFMQWGLTWYPTDSKKPKVLPTRSLGALGQLAGVASFLSENYPDRIGNIKILSKIAVQPFNNVLHGNYFSMTPYLWGDPKNADTKPMKFATVPINCTSNQPLEKIDNVWVPNLNPLDVARRKSPDKLRESLHRSLKTDYACFAFRVQIQTNDADMPVEKPTVEWKQSQAPFQTVAKVIIFPNQFTSEEFCENLSFTPWHGLVEHQPLGAINRARRKVYEHISKLRHRLNGAARKEPDGTERF